MCALLNGVAKMATEENRARDFDPTFHIGSNFLCLMYTQGRVREEKCPGRRERDMPVIQQ